MCARRVQAPHTTSRLSGLGKMRCPEVNNAHYPRRPALAPKVSAQASSCSYPRNPPPRPGCSR
eukprot:7982959-Alexandrium_andersonii.AAC.1